MDLQAAIDKLTPAAGAAPTTYAPNGAPAAPAAPGTGLVGGFMQGPLFLPAAVAAITYFASGDDNKNRSWKWAAAAAAVAFMFQKR
jgi:hypothetical protein